MMQHILSNLFNWVFEPTKPSKAKATPKVERTCDQMGVCQKLPIPCLLCDKPWPEEDTLTPMEQIAGWLVIAVIGTCTVVTLAGGASYIYFRWIAP